MDADAEKQAPVRRNVAHVRFEIVLDGKRCGDGACGCLEDGEDRIARHVDNSALACLDFLAEDSARRVERRNRGAVVDTHQARVADCIGGQDRRQTLPCFRFAQRPSLEAHPTRTQPALLETRC